MNFECMSLASLNSNPNYDFKNAAEFVFENDDWPNPYSYIDINSMFYDSDSFVEAFAGHPHPVFLTLNVQSLMSKHDKLKNFIMTLNQRNVYIAVIALQEIWSVPYAELVNIPGYKFVHRSRGTGRGGGVGFYIKDNLNCNILDLCPSVDSQFENIIIETTICRKKYILCNIYRAPSSVDNVSQRDLIENYNSRIEELLSILGNLNVNALIFSDCNINLLKINVSPLTAEYLDTCHTNGFIVTNFKATRIQNNSFSLIDHVLSNNINADIITGSIICDISDHFPVFYSCKDVTVPRDDTTFMSRNTSYAKMVKFRDDLQQLRWQNVLSKRDVNAALNNFLDIFLTLFELHFPLTKKKFNRNYDKINEFMTNGLLTSRRKKNFLFKKQLARPSVENIQAFRNYRNVYNAVLRKSKKMYFEHVLKKFKTKPKKLWDILNTANGGCKSKSTIKEIEKDNTLYTKDNDIAEIFNDFFTEVGQKIQDEIEPTDKDPLSYFPENFNAPDFTINNTGPVHVIDVIKAMYNKSSSDCNNISMKLIKFVAYEISVPLAHIFQLSIESGIFPDKFKASRVVPIFKQGSPKTCDNYRPIALVNSFSKILEKMVAIDLYNHLDLNNLLYKNQYGFQRNKSTEHNLLQVTNFIGNALNDGDWCIGIFLDLKKAFDTVQHDILLRKLEKYGVRGTALAWFASYLANRTQCVDINGTLSDFKHILMSVLQGSTLGPILFLCFINDIYNCTLLSMFLFADDTNALAKGNNLSNLIDFINVELQKVALWFKSNKLVINVSKTKYMIFRTRNRNVNLNGKDIFMNFNEPNTVERPELKIKLNRVHNEGDISNQTYKLLGVLFDEYLSFNQHIVHVQNKLSKALFLLNRSKNFLSSKALKLLYFATIHSHLSYCPIIMGMAPKTQLNKLTVMQKKAIRIVVGAGYHDHTANHFVNLRILPFDLIITQSKLKFMHSVKYSYCPKSFNDMFTPLNHENLAYELRYPNDFDVPRARIEIFKKMPCYSLPDEWNKCEELRFYHNQTTFNIILFETLLSKFAHDNGLTGLVTVN
jgi:Reverse transcriptase (RNA-dependent DNA polymerase)